jgi:adenosylhomocysteine nucleosidase
MRLLITVALHPEARPLITHFGLKQDTTSHAVPIFHRENHALAVSGVGRLKSAIATTYLLSRISSLDDVILLNIGIAGHTQVPKAGSVELGDLFLVHKITEQATGHTFYPDMLVKSPIAESVLTTVDRPLDRSDNMKIESGLVDMEAAGFYQAAATFLAPHQIHCIKIVSDFLEVQRFDKAWISTLIGQRLSDIDHIIAADQTVTLAPSDILDRADLQIIEQLNRKLRLTASQHKMLTDTARAYKLHTGKTLPDLSAFTQIAVTTKQEGKDRIERLRQRLMVK